MGASCSADTSNTPSSASACDTQAPVSKALLNLLGPTLLSSGNSEVATASALAGKSVAVYFSAHWCPPCRNFTPKLANAYKSHLKAKGLEVIFVSSDRDAKAFEAYFQSQPWLAVPFKEQGVKAALSKKYGIRGIPSLILIDEDGELLDADGRGKVMSDPTGKWVRTPRGAVAPVVPVAGPDAAESMKSQPSPGAQLPSLQAVLGSEPLLATDGRTPMPLADVVKGAPLVGVYFSAHWCGPCRAFTPKLVAFIEKLKEEGVHMPIVFGSSDNDEASFQSYFKTMPWVAFPHGDARIEKLKAKYSADGIPWLVVLDAYGNLVLNEADTDVPKGSPAYKEWLEKAERAVGCKLMAGAPAA